MLVETNISAIRRLALARAISLAGTDASAIAVSVALYVQTRSTIWLAAGMIVTIGGASVLGPFGGVLADRFDRRRLMIGAEVTGAAAFALLFFSHSPAAILAVSVVATCAGVVFGPAAGAAVPALAGERRLAWANGLVSSGAAVGKTAGRLGAGILAAAAGYASVFAVDAFTFLLSALLVLSVRADFNGDPSKSGAERLRRMRWTQLLSIGRARPVVLSSCAATFATSFSMTAETVLAFDYEAGMSGLGALAACWGAGMLVGSRLAGKVLGEDNELFGLLAGRLLSGCALAAVGLVPAFAATLPCYLAGGAAGGFLLVASQNILQRSAAPRALGRMLATAESMKTAAFGVGVAIAGFAVAAIGARPTYVLVGAAVIAGSLPLGLAVGRERAASAEAGMATA